MKLALKLPARFPPRNPRASVEIEGTLLLPDDDIAAIFIRNISPEGLMGETAARLRSGAWVGVALPGCGIVPAQVRWAADGEIGAQFRWSLDLEKLQHDPPSGPLFRSHIVQGPL